MPRAPQTFRLHPPAPHAPSSAGKRARGRALMMRRRRVFDDDNWRCRACGQHGTERTLRADHIQPLSQGGSDHVVNMQTLCISCHEAKTAAERRLESDRRGGEGSDCGAALGGKPPARGADMRAKKRLDFLGGM